MQVQSERRLAGVQRRIPWAESFGTERGAGRRRITPWYITPDQLHCTREMNSKTITECKCMWGTPKTFLGKSKRGLTNGGLSPKISEKIGQQSLRANRAFSRLSGAFSGPIGAFSGPIGTNSSAPHSPGEEQKLPRKGPFGPIGAFRAKPPFAPVWISATFTAWNRTRFRNTKPSRTPPENCFLRLVPLKVLSTLLCLQSSFPAYSP